MKIGIGTYSFGGIASFLGLGPTLKEKFESMKALGYTQVELLAGDLDNDVEDIKKWAEEVGVEIVSIHAEPSEEVVKKMAAIGGKMVILASSRFNCKAEAIELAKQLDEWAEMAEPYGIKVGYHNHSSEFYVDEGKPILEWVIENSSKCYFQLDCGWAMNAGTYPPSFLRKYRNRFCAIHIKENCKVNGPGPQPASRHAEDPRRAGGSPFGNIKEMSIEERKAILAQMEERMKNRGGEGAPQIQCKMGVWESNIDWKEIKKALDEQDFEAYWIVEREDFYTDHDQCLKEDCEWLTANIL